MLLEDEENDAGESNGLSVGVLDVVGRLEGLKLSRDCPPTSECNT